MPYNITATATIFKPFLYIFNITNQCNVSCPHCCQKKSMSQAGADLSPSEILGIVKKLPWYAVVVLSGGEPLCRKDFLKIVEGITRQKKKSALLTNGLLLDDSIICGIIRNKLLNIGITIDGDKKYYEEVKGKGNYIILMDKIDRLSYYKKKMKSLFPAFDYKVTVFPGNINLLPILYQQAVDYGANTFTVSLPKKNNFQFSDFLYGTEILDLIPKSTDINEFPDNTREIYKELFSISRQVKTRLRTYPVLKKAHDIENYFCASDIQKRYSACRKPWSGLVISVRGEVYPCLSVRIGDLKRQSLSQILMSPENTRFREQLKKNKFLPLCEGCCYANLKPLEQKGRFDCEQNSLYTS